MVLIFALLLYWLATVTYRGSIKNGVALTKAVFGLWLSSEEPLLPYINKRIN